MHLAAPAPTLTPTLTPRARSAIRCVSLGDRFISNRHAQTTNFGQSPGPMLYQMQVHRSSCIHRSHRCLTKPPASVAGWLQHGPGRLTASELAAVQLPAQAAQLPDRDSVTGDLGAISRAGQLQPGRRLRHAGALRGEECRLVQLRLVGAAERRAQLQEEHLHGQGLPPRQPVRALARPARLPQQKHYWRR